MLLVALLSALLSAQTIGAANPPERATSVRRFFSWSPWVPEELRSALEDYENGSLFDAAAVADRGLRSREAQGFRDDLLLVRGLALAELGWRTEAAESFSGILEASVPSPYYPLALLGLVESHHRGGRFEAVAAACRRYFERPWRGDSRRDKLIRNFLTAYGELSTSKLRFDGDEADLIGNPAKLAEKLSHRKERPSERLLYLCGLDLFRLKDYAASLESLERIGVVSFYFPYALYTAAQDLYALDRRDDARAKIALLLRYPALAREERALSDRAGLFLVQMLFESGRIDEALAASRSVGGDGRYALATRLLRAEIYLATEQPSLAVAFSEELRGKQLGPRLVAQRGLDLGLAYSKLADLPAATASLKTAVDEVNEVRASLDPTTAEHEIADLRVRIERGVSAEQRFAARDRARIAAGVRRVTSFKGPLNLGKLVRVVFAPHRHTILGAPVYDTARLAERERFPGIEAPGSDGLWFAYVQSPLRAGIEEAIATRLGLDYAADEREHALRVLDALLGALDGRFAASGRERAPELARLAARLARALGVASESDESSLRAEPGAPLAAEVAATRRRLLERLGDDAGEAAVDRALVDEARAAAGSRLEDAVSFGLARVASAEAEELRHLEFRLRAELSEALAKQSGIAHSSAEADSR